MMGNPADPKFQDVVTLNQDGSTTTESTQAYYSSDIIYLNPKFFDKRRADYIELGDVEKARIVAHEIGHDFNLHHPNGYKGESGIMSNEGERILTKKEIQTIFDKQNDKIIQPTEK